MKIKGSILFVDDDEIVLALLKRHLSAEYETEFAHNGQEALELLACRRFDVMVTDIWMPKMNGLDLIDVVKERYPNMVRMVLSGYTQAQTIIYIANHGDIFRFIPKPLQMTEEYLQMFSQAVDHARSLRHKQESYQKTMSSLIELLRDQHYWYILMNRNGDIRVLHPALGPYFPDMKLNLQNVLQAPAPEGPDAYEVITLLGNLNVRQRREVYILSDHLELIMVEPVLESKGGLVIG